MSRDPRPPLGVLLDGGQRERDRERSVPHYGGYAVEILEHGGVPFETLDRSRLRSTPGGNGRGDEAPDLPSIVLLPHPIRLSPREVARLDAHVRAGGAVLACGGVEGADTLFGIATTRRHLDEARLTWPQGGLGLAAAHAPVWGAQIARAARSDGAGDDVAEVLGEVRGPGGEVGIAEAHRTIGAGFALYLAIDVARSVVTMQQGRPVLGDGPGAPDGSAGIDDRILKADDGAVIGWDARSNGPEGPYFADPFADRLRELLMAAIVECTERIRVLLPVKAYWPAGVPAVATLSYDTDSNEDADGRALLETVERLEVHGTWCVMFPGGYSRELYDAIGAYGDEIALHYDGLTGDLKDAPHCGWSRQDFEHQFTWLKSETGVARVVSQKNHVTRWEGWVELFRWVEATGIAVDGSKGPSKIGNLGFPFGTCHPWRPMEDGFHDHRLMDVLELCFLTHDMHHSPRRVALRRMLLDTVARHGGVAHFIFHPQRIHEEGMREALADLVAAARAKGMPWWTNERIATWEAARRKARVLPRPAEGGGAPRTASARLAVADAPDGLTVLLFGLGADPADAASDVTWRDAFGRRVATVTF